MNFWNKFCMSLGIIFVLAVIIFWIAIKLVWLLILVAIAIVVWFVLRGIWKKPKNTNENIS
jgi:hypothetical protein